MSIQPRISPTIYAKSQQEVRTPRKPFAAQLAVPSELAASVSHVGWVHNYLDAWLATGLAARLAVLLAAGCVAVC